MHDICLLVEDKPRLMLPLLFPICTVLDQSQTISQYQLDILKSVLNKLLDFTNSKKFAAANERFNEELREYVSNFSEDSVQHAIIASFFEYIDPHILNKEEAKRKNCSMMNFVDPIKQYEMFGVQVQEGVVVPRMPLYFTAHEGTYTNESKRSRFNRNSTIQSLLKLSLILLSQSSTKRTVTRRKSCC